MQNQNIDSPIINNNAGNLEDNIKITKEINKGAAEKAPEKIFKEKKKTTYPIKKVEIKRGGNSISGRLFIAILLVSLGLIFIAKNYNIISFDIFESIALFWPLIFIFIGIFVSLKENWWPIMLSLFVLALIAAMTVITARKKDGNSGKNYAAVSELEAGSIDVDGMIAGEAGNKK